VEGEELRSFRLGLLKRVGRGYGVVGAGVKIYGVGVFVFGRACEMSFYF
jgi:hypothetical protein